MTRCCIHRLDRSEESRHDLHVKIFLPICYLHPVKLTATEIEDEMQDLVNRARCIARKRSGEMPADAPTKVKRVRCLLDKGSCTAGKRSGELIAESSAKVKCVQNTSFAVTGESKLQACFTSGKRFEELIADSTSNTKRVQNPWQNNGKRSGELTAESSAKVKRLQNLEIAVAGDHSRRFCYVSSACPCGKPKKLDVA